MKLKIEPNKMHNKYSFKVRPFFVEAFAHLPIDILIFIAIPFVIFLCNASSPVLWIAAFEGFYLIVAYLLFYRVIINALIDKHKNTIITERVQFYSINPVTNWFSGDFMGMSKLASLYPEKEKLDKYAVCVICDEKKIYLRSIMSRPKFWTLFLWDVRYKSLELEVTYAKHSKILLWVNVPKEAYGHCDKKKVRQMEKDLHNLNYTL